MRGTLAVSIALRYISATEDGRAPVFTPRDSERSSLTAVLREAKVLCDARHFGDQEMSPSHRATRDPGGRSSLTAVSRETTIVFDGWNRA